MSCNKIWACSESKYIQAYIIFDPSVPQSSRIQNIFGLYFISWNFIFYQSIELKTKITNLKSKTLTKINYDIDFFIEYSKLTIWTFKKPRKIHCFLILGFTDTASQMWMYCTEHFFTLKILFCLILSEYTITCPHNISCGIF